jgi:hypothetical protein
LADALPTPLAIWGVRRKNWVADIAELRKQLEQAHAKRAGMGQRKESHRRLVEEMLRRPARLGASLKGKPPNPAKEIFRSNLVIFPVYIRA